MPPDRRAPRVEIIRSMFGCENRNRMRPQMGVKCVADGVVSHSFVRSTWATCARAMDASIGSAGALYQRFIAGERFDRGCEQALHGELVSLDLPAGEWAPVIFDRQLVAWHVTPPARRISPACRARTRPPTSVAYPRAALA